MVRPALLRGAGGLINLELCTVQLRFEVAVGGFMCRLCTIQQDLCPMLRKFLRRFLMANAKIIHFGGRFGDFLVTFFRHRSLIDFGMHFDRLLAPFWLPFGSLWLPLAPFWLPLASFCSPWAALGLPPGSLWRPFGVLLLPLGELLAPVGHLLASSTAFSHF